MAPIKNIINDITSSERLRQQERVSSTQSEKAQKRGQVQEGTTVESRQDKVDISAAARELAETRSSDVARYREMLQSLRNEEGDHIGVVRERVTQGEYDRPEVLEEVADTISRLPQFQALAESAPERPQTKELTGAIAQRIRSGQYDSDQVLERVAMNILRDMGAA
ncbi:MAG: hypothetical protein V3W14_12165 [Candidatus Neomarinimicrobiota bacterium]